MDLLIKCNVGPRERLARFAAGVAATAGAFYAPNKGAKIALGAIGAAGLATGVTRYCPLNHALGVNRCQPAYRSVRELMRRL